MKIALLGYGKMGKEVEKVARERNHEIILTIDIQNSQELTVDNLALADAAIEFSVPQAAYRHVLTCFEAHIPVVCGTTGWFDKVEEVKRRCLEENQTFFYSPNFSIGVNVVFALNSYLAKIMNQFREYEVSIREIHHIHKIDAPSGTAISLANDLIEVLAHKKSWELNVQKGDDSVIGITSEREGEVPGTHYVTYESAVDIIQLVHIAKNRRGLALGAVLAAEFIKGRKGVYAMKDLMRL
jgi:4-hydroxy-tetrahydrodipicolinate reductase